MRRCSYLQALGFAVLVWGTFVYKRGDEADTAKDVEEVAAIAAANEPMPDGNGAYNPASSGECGCVAT